MSMIPATPTYLRVRFADTHDDVNQLLIASLSEIGFDGFEELDPGLHAFIVREDFNHGAVQEIAERFNVSFEVGTIEPKNWNEEWESNFEPIRVGNFVGVRAEFHPPFDDVEQDILITPKMSFGTGHHATTWLMIQTMQKLDWVGKRVFDFGTGTGILAILAEKLGAAEIVAIDNDDWSIANAAENLQRNGCTRIRLEKASSPGTHGPFDFILANINKHVILENLARLCEMAAEGALIILSGLLASDEADILAATSGFSVKNRENTLRNNWICMVFEC